MTIEPLVSLSMSFYTNPVSQHLPHQTAEVNFNHSDGFTLPELLTASLITGLIVMLAGVGLVNLTQITQKSEKETEHRDRLSMALDFIANDIRESKSVSTTVTQDRGGEGFTNIFEVTRNDDSTVTYYSKDVPSESPWLGPKVIYRYVSADADPDPHALVDAIADVNPGCASIGSESSNSQGLTIFIQDSTQTKVCLSGELEPGNTVLLETVTFARNTATP